MPALLGKKIGMTNLFTNEGESIPVTVIEAGPCQVLGIRTSKKDGYSALQIGFGEKKESKLISPERGFYKKNNTKPSAVIKEFKNFETSEYKVGDFINLNIFSEGEKVKVTGISIGKGFQGVMRRHGFGGVGGTTHGQSDRLRAPGSIGQSSWPSRVFKGTKMAGRTGHKRVTVANLKIVKIIEDKNILFVKGGIPGPINSFVEIRK